MKKVLATTEHKIQAFPMLFKYWQREVLLAVRDLVYKCSHQSHSLRVKNLFVADVGIKLFFKSESYGLPKQEGLRHHLIFEAQALRNYAELITELLTGQTDPSALSSLPDIDPELKCIVTECHRAIKTLEEPELSGASLKKEMQEFMLARNRAITSDKKQRKVIKPKKVGKEELSEEKGKERYLTVQGLINHPYFAAISQESDVTQIIEEYERLREST